jgi:hypothetical protein
VRDRGHRISCSRVGYGETDRLWRTVNLTAGDRRAMSGVSAVQVLRVRNTCCRKAGRTCLDGSVKDLNRAQQVRSAG